MLLLLFPFLFFQTQKEESEIFTIATTQIGASSSSSSSSSSSVVAVAAFLKFNLIYSFDSIVVACCVCAVCANFSLSSKIYSQYQRKVLNDVKVVSISASNTDVVGNSNTIV